MNKKLIFFILILLVLLAALLMRAYGHQGPVKSDPRANTTDCKWLNDVRYCTKDFIGLTEDEAVSKAENAGLAHRIVSRDGESFPVTMDYSEYRVNFTIENQKVTAATFG